MVDHRRRQPRSSLELSPRGAARLGSSPQVEEKAEEVTGNLTEGTVGQLNGKVRSAVVDRGGNGFVAWTTC
jgi:hypothetical protein